jgi:tRNA A37 methylthiotransferase MiaB
MKQLNGKLIKERSRAMSKLARLTMEERNRTWLGWKGKVLIDEVGKPGTWIGRNYAYKPVVVRLEDNVLGKELTVEVKRIHPTYLEANVAG